MQFFPAQMRMSRTSLTFVYLSPAAMTGIKSFSDCPGVFEKWWILKNSIFNIRGPEKRGGNVRNSNQHESLNFCPASFSSFCARSIAIEYSRRLSS